MKKRLTVIPWTYLPPSKPITKRTSSECSFSDLDFIRLLCAAYVANDWSAVEIGLRMAAGIPLPLHACEWECIREPARSMLDHGLCGRHIAMLTLFNTILSVCHEAQFAPVQVAACLNVAVDALDLVLHHSEKGETEQGSATPECVAFTVQEEDHVRRAIVATLLPYCRTEVQTAVLEDKTRLKEDRQRITIPAVGDEADAPVSETERTLKGAGSKAVVNNGKAPTIPSSGTKGTRAVAEKDTPRDGGGATDSSSGNAASQIDTSVELPVRYREVAVPSLFSLEDVAPVLTTLQQALLLHYHLYHVLCMDDRVRRNVDEAESSAVCGPHVLDIPVPLKPLAHAMDGAKKSLRDARRMVVAEESTVRCTTELHEEDHFQELRLHERQHSERVHEYLCQQREAQHQAALHPADYRRVLQIVQYRKKQGDRASKNMVGDPLETRPPTAEQSRPRVSPTTSRSGYIPTDEEILRQIEKLEQALTIATPISPKKGAPVKK